MTILSTKILSFLLLIFIIAYVYFLIIRSYLLNKDKSQLLNNLYKFIFINSLITLIFFSGVKIGEYQFFDDYYTSIGFEELFKVYPHKGYAFSQYYLVSPLLLLINFDSNYLFQYRIIAIIILILSVIGIIFSHKKRKLIFLLISLTIGLISHFIIPLDFQTSKSIASTFINWEIVIYLILLLIAYILIFKLNKSQKKDKESTN